MRLFSLFLIAIGLSMDAFAISVCKGLAMKKITFQKACIVGIWFGAFQAIMPGIGYLLGGHFEQYILAIDHWIAFTLLSLIGLSMIREALSPKMKAASESLDPKTMALLAFATSIDALAVGITLAFLQVSIVPAMCFIGSTTFLFSAVGVRLGHSFGIHYKKPAEIIGGALLILMGTKILLEHLGIAAFPI